MAKKQSEFLKMPELIDRSFSKLNAKQSDVLKAHQAAARAWDDFLETGKKRSIGIMQRKFSNHSVAEFRANTLALVALKKAITYYNLHGKLESAYDELREVAREHWHPAVHEMWHLHFQKCADAAKIEISGALEARISKATERDLNLTLAALHHAKYSKERRN